MIDDRRALIDRLVQALRDLSEKRENLSVRPFVPLGAVAELFAKPADPWSVFYLVAPRVRIAKQFDFDPAPDLLIVDQKLGTLGLVFVIGPGNLKEQVRTCVDQATYARHLLLTDSQLGRRVPYSVELVLVSERSAVGAIGEALREIARKTSCLYAIGVNLLQPSEVDLEHFDERGLRRAFSWLLCHTRHWYSRQFGLSRSRTAQSRIESLELERYRLPGRRKLELAKGDIRIHLVYGHNGSGKSSLVEALELVLTGSIERLAQSSSSYLDVIRNSGSQGEVRIVLGYSDGKKEEVFVQEKGPDRILGGKRRHLQATSFRLDQTVMDRLTRAGGTQRATTFLGAFFPKDSQEYRTYYARQAEARKAFDNLPQDLRGAIESSRKPKEAVEEAVLRFFARLDPKHYLPVPPELLRDLIPIARSLAPVIEPWLQEPPQPPPPEALKENLRMIDEALDSLRPELDRKLEAFRLARETLQTMSAWHLEDTSAPEGDPAEVLNAWLELVALADLGDKQLQLARTLWEACQQKNWSLEVESPADLFSRPPLSLQQIEELEKQVAGWKESREKRFDQVKSLLGQTRMLPSGSSAPRPPQPRRNEIRALNEVGLWLEPSSADGQSGALGYLISQAISGRRQSFGALTIGAHGWATTLLERAARLEAACKKLDEALPGWMSCGRRLELFDEILKRHRAARQAGRRVRRTFIRRISGDGGSDPGLNNALNELMTLWTPARWAYEDIFFLHETADDQSRMPLRTGSADADLRLNTAELNLFTLALFLLCAVRPDNPLHLLVLDDPLQHMDELTVTTLARGLARLSWLLPEPWQLLLLFHGEEDLERFRREVPAAAYDLPWLAPLLSTAESGDTPPILQRPELRSREIQDLSSLLEDKPIYPSRPAAPRQGKAQTK